MTWTLRPNVEALPHIGPGPLTDEAYEAAEAAYLRAHYGDGVEIPADAQRPRDTGIYQHGPAAPESGAGKAAKKATATEAGDEESI